MLPIPRSSLNLELRYLTLGGVKQDRSKFGTDPRYPNWSGTVLDPKFINAGITIALLVNLAAIGLVHHDKLQTHNAFWQTTAPLRFLLALVICGATLLLIHHTDRVVQWGARAFACGLPLVLNVFLVLQRLPLKS